MPKKEIELIGFFILAIAHRENLLGRQAGHAATVLNRELAQKIIPTNAITKI